MNRGYGDPEREIEQYQADQDIDAILATAESADELPAEAEVEVGSLLTPSEIRNADALGRIAGSAWYWQCGTRCELRRVPKALERVARSHARRTDE